MGISRNTRLNWQRLQVERSKKLQQGANKSRSRKRFFPTEYISRRESLAFAAKVLAAAQEKQLEKENILFSLAVKLLKEAGIFELEHVQNVLKEFPQIPDEELAALEIPSGETDILGFIYQCLLSEGEKNASGSYYTPQEIVRSMVEDLDFSNGGSFLDPCCGSGAFFLALKNVSPNQIFGCDKDPLAVFIAKVNLLCRFPEQSFTPQIFCCDYLKSAGKNFRGRVFDHIATNPPWGAGKNGRKESDSFSLFFKKACKHLKENGRIHFLFPESVLKIRIHAGIRQFILSDCCLEEVVLHTGAFTGVMTKYVDLRIRKAPPGKSFRLWDGSRFQTLEVESILRNEHHAFLFVSPQDREIREQVLARKNHFLAADAFALGIVTGDNKNKVKKEFAPGLEAVFTGKEVAPYVLKPAERYLHYVRENFQQVARETYYRAPEKLIYKFISDQLVFAYDDTGALVLNSANILIPQIPGMCIKTVLAFLNSRFLRYYYPLLSADIKILKSHLMQLPFPEISPETDLEIREIIDLILAGDFSREEKLQEIIFNAYGLTAEQTAYIEQQLSGRH